uniref:Ig-like domain-containing protein n=1 Tax=Strongyloides stercoralis TaxID=6248 RepID=A0AAF5CY92_STRER
MVINYFYFVTLLLFVDKSIEANGKLQNWIKEDNLINGTLNHSLYKSYNLSDLQEFKSVIHYFDYINLTKTKYLIINWDEIMLMKGKLEPNVYINIFYPENTTTNIINNNKRTSRWKLECTIDSCTFGLKFILNNKHYTDLLSYNKIIEPDYSLLIMFKMREDKLSLKTVSFGGHNYPLYFCPTKNWFTNESNISFQADENILNIHDWKGLDSKKILVPIFPQTIDSEFFVCGIIKQPTLSDIKVGYNIKRNNEKDMAILENCNISISDLYFLFTYLDTEYSYDGRRKMIKADHNNNDIFYGEIYYFYSYYNSIGMINQSLINEPLKPRCLIKSKSAEKNSIIVPRFLWNNDLILFKKNNINYYVIDQKFYNRYFIGRCLRYEGIHSDPSLDKFFLHAVDLELRKETFDNDEFFDTDNIVFTKDNLNSYGYYTCNILSGSKNFFINNIAVENVYIIPENHSIFYYPTINSKEEAPKTPPCKKSYGNYSYLTHIKVNFFNTSENNISINMNSNNSAEGNSSNVNLKDFNEDFYVTCIYKTIVDTIFEIQQPFNYKKILKKEVIRMEKILVFDYKLPILIIIPSLITSYILFRLFLCCIRAIVKRSSENEKEYPSTESEDTKKTTEEDSVEDVVINLEK